MVEKIVARSIRLMFVGGIAVSAMTQTAYAQQAPAADAPLQQVVVTGSMMKRVDAETAEAVTIIKSETLKDMGVTSVEQALALVTSNNSTVTTAVAVGSFSGGVSEVSLRGLGATKTLVLLDGQRLANNVASGAGVDLNTIPFSAIDHIEVLREGASALYGSDAIAGVINFITQKDLVGGEINVGASLPQSAGGKSGTFDLAWGKGNLSEDGYNFMATLNHSEQKELKASQRSFASTGYNPALGLANVNGVYGTAPGSYTDTNGSLWQVGYPSCGNNTLTAQYFYSRFELTTWGGPQSYSFNVNPTNAYFPTAGNSTCVSCTTATPNLTDPITAYWTDLNNNRYQGVTNTEQRFLLTFAGANAGWDYSTSFDWSQNKGVQQVYGGYANYAKISTNNTLSDLINPFGPQSAAGQALINSAYTNGDLSSGTLTLSSFNGHASHSLGDVFNAGRQVQFAVGFDFRSEKISETPTQLATDLYTATYYPPTTVVGSRNSKSLFAEVNVPV